MNYLNGRYVETPFSEGELYGTGVFETIRVTAGNPEYIKEHYHRLCNGCTALDISLKISYGEFQNLLHEYIRKISVDNFGLRFTILKRGTGYDVMISNRYIPYTNENYKNGFSVKTSSLRKNPTSPLTYIKSTCYTDNLISLKKSRSMGFDETLHLNFKNEICEGAVSNIFFIKDGLVKTPAIECGLLSGIMREQVLKKLKENNILYEEGNYFLEEILESEEVFLTNSLMGIIWVNRIDNKIYTKRKNTDIISKFII